MNAQKHKLLSKSKLMSKKKVFSATMSGSLLMAAVLVPTAYTLFSPQITAKAAVLGIEALSNITSTNNSNTTPTAPFAGGTTQNVNFTIHGYAPVGVQVLSGTRYAVLTIPQELLGNVTPGTANVTTNVTIDLNQVPLLSTVVQSTNALITTLTNILNGSLGTLAGVQVGPTTPADLTALVSELQNIGGINYNATTSLSTDGKLIQANLDNGLGPILTTNVIDVLQRLETAISNLQVTVTAPNVNPITDPIGAAQYTAAVALAGTVNTALSPVQATANLAINNLLTPLLGGTGGVAQQLLTASVLGDTTVNIPTTINVPTISSGLVDSKFVGTVVQTNTLDVSLLSTANGVSDVYWAGVPNAPTATATGNSTTGYTVTGTADPNTTITIKDGSGATVATATTDATGHYSTTVAGTVGQNATLTATASNSYGASTATSFQTPANPVAPTAPVITSVTGNSQTGYVVTGTANAGTTVNIYENGTVVGTAVADVNGNFTINLPGSIGANTALTATATNTAGTVSSATNLTTPADPIPAPPTAIATGNSTTGYTVTGIAEANATVTITNPTTNAVLGTAIAGIDGSYSIVLPAGTQPGESLNATATNAFGTSSTTTFITPADPIPSAPTATITGNSQTGYVISGMAAIGSTVTVTNPTTGQVLGTTTAGVDGSYSINLAAGVLVANQSVNVTATTPAGTSTPASVTTPNDPTVSSPMKA